ncbi:MAG TPA: phytanoyl-CoA dioxygenase family protein [Armatimonadota bacterium]|jgi:ectoine hydroxylase-related dioxygenase (phytanoyl-CoA dioxygenase family)
MLTQEQVDSFDQNGYLNCGLQVLDDETLHALRNRLDAVMEGRAQGQAEAVRNLAGGTLESDKVVVQVVNAWQADDRFYSHLFNPIITQAVARLCGCHTLRVWHDQVQYKPPIVGTATGWHQDYPAWPVLEPADLVSCWVALDDATQENGCMSMVPGSHRWGAHGPLASGPEFMPSYDQALLPPGAEVRVVPCEVKAGCALFHHCLTWHGSPPNPSPKPRRAIAVHYMPGYTRYQPKGGHLVEHHIEVAPGEVLRGRFFPTVLEDDAPLRPDEFVGWGETALA